MCRGLVKYWVQCSLKNTNSVNKLHLGIGINQRLCPQIMGASRHSLGVVGARSGVNRCRGGPSQIRVGLTAIVRKKALTVGGLLLATYMRLAKLDASLIKLLEQLW